MKKRYEEENCMTTHNCDRNKIAKVSGVLQIMQEAGRKQMALERPSYDELHEQGMALMLSRLDLVIHEPIYCGEPIIVSSWPAEASRATFPRNYAICRDGELVAEVASQWALVDIASRKVLKADEADFSNYYMGEYEEIYKGKFRIARDISLEESGKHVVQYTDLDYNGHMNNTYYMDVLCNNIPELAAGTHRVESVRVHYNNEAPLGDVLTVMRAQTEEGKYLFRTVKANGEINIDAEMTLATL